MLAKIFNWNKKTKTVDIPDSLKAEIFNVLWDKYLTNLLFALKKYWFIKYSSNIINEFEEEKELKILDIDFQDLENKLKKLWAKKYFEWNIEDIYYDYWDFRFDNWSEKISFRIRKKNYDNWKEKLFYTIKRKKSEDSLKNWLRICYEKEFEIDHMWAFKDIIIDVLELIKMRKKEKRRVAYELWDIKFDIDFYKWIPPLLEIEAKHSSIAKKYIQELWLEKNETCLSWSRWLFKRYWIKYEVFNSKENQDNLKNL